MRRGCRFAPCDAESNMRRGKEDMRRRVQHATPKGKPRARRRFSASKSVRAQDSRELAFHGVFLNITRFAYCFLHTGFPGNLFFCFSICVFTIRLFSVVPRGRHDGALRAIQPYRYPTSSWFFWEIRGLPSGVPRISICSETRLNAILFFWGRPGA